MPLASSLRGVYRSKARLQGRPVYYCLTEDGAVPEGGIRTVWERGTDAEVVAQLAGVLDRVNPVRTLRLVRDPAPATRLSPASAVALLRGAGRQSA